MGKVLYLGDFKLPDKNAAAQRVVNVSKILMKLNKEVILCGISEEIVKSDKKQQIKGTSLYYYEKSKRGVLGKIKGALNLKFEISLIKKIKNLEMIICYNYNSLNLLMMMIYCRRNNIKLVGDVTEWYDKSRLGFPLNLVKNLDTFIRMKYLNKKLDGLICISRYLEEYYSKDILTVYIPGLVDQDDPKWKISKVRNKFENGIEFIYMGNPGKNCEKERLDLLIKSVCTIQNEKNYFKLKIVGVLKEEFEKNYFKLKEMKNYEKRIEYYGKLSHEKAIKELKNSSFSIIPREKKINNIAGFPTKLGESFCANVPVITTLVGDIGEYVSEGKNGFIVKECDVSSIKEKLEYILNNDKLHKKSYDILYNELDYTNFCLNLENFLQELKNDKI